MDYQNSRVVLSIFINKPDRAIVRHFEFEDRPKLEEFLEIVYARVHEFGHGEPTTLSFLANRAIYIPVLYLNYN